MAYGYPNRSTAYSTDVGSLWWVTIDSGSGAYNVCATQGKSFVNGVQRALIAQVPNTFSAMGSDHQRSNIGTNGQPDGSFGPTSLAALYYAVNSFGMDPDTTRLVLSAIQEDYDGNRNTYGTRSGDPLSLVTMQAMAWMLVSSAAIGIPNIRFPRDTIAVRYVAKPPDDAGNAGQLQCGPMDPGSVQAVLNQAAGLGLPEGTAPVSAPGVPPGGTAPPPGPQPGPVQPTPAGGTTGQPGAGTEAPSNVGTYLAVGAVAVAGLAVVGVLLHRRSAAAAHTTVNIRQTEAHRGSLPAGSHRQLPPPGGHRGSSHASGSHRGGSHGRRAA
jgi:hypothetical protein